ncbi:ABC transporter substrate-binding protein [Streptosporangium sp. NPDC048047]|uniref:ABC transporter substrate-binding protein n=1 Tax=Streptosporangium sp. NPDC048047 TaxID=3155748 RepID=UPI00343D73A4
MRRFLHAIVLLPLVVAPGCAYSSDNPATTVVEKGHIVVGAMPIPDAAPLYIAQKRGFFTAEGLTVDIQAVQGAGYAIPRLIGGGMDIAILNYITAIKAHSQGLKLRLIADSYQAGPGTFLLMVTKNSPIASPADLRGKTIAVATLQSIGTLTTEVALKIHGLTAKDVTMVEIPLPNMPAALEAGTVDACWMTEPFINAVSIKGARKLWDVMSGPTEGFPIAGWGVSEQFAAKHPKTIAAFQRALAKAQHLAAADRGVVTAILPTYTKIGPETAKLITLGTFPTSIATRRLQRVADTMRDYGYLTAPVDVSKMLLPQAGPAETPTTSHGARP